jgi:hypothetical protein
LFKNTLPGNRSSEQKVMPILRRTLWIRFLWQWKLNRMRIGGSVDGKKIVDWIFFCRWQQMEETKLN